MYAMTAEAPRNNGVEDQHVFDGPRVVTDADVMGIVKLVDDRLGAWSTLITEHMTTMKELLVAKLDGNTEAASLRWKVHETESGHEHETLRGDLTGFDKRLGTVEDQVRVHLQTEHDEDLAARARVKPVLTVIQTVRAYWAQILLIAMVISALLSTWRP